MLPTGGRCPRAAQNIYNGYKDAPGDFKNLSDEIKSLHNIVNSDILTAKNLTSEEQRSWKKYYKDAQMC